MYLHKLISSHDFYITVRTIYMDSYQGKLGSSNQNHWIRVLFPSKLDLIFIHVKTCLFQITWKAITRNFVCACTYGTATHVFTLPLVRQHRKGVKDPHDGIVFDLG